MLRWKLAVGMIVIERNEVFFIRGEWAQRAQIPSIARRFGLRNADGSILSDAFGRKIKYSSTPAPFSPS